MGRKGYRGRGGCGRSETRRRRFRGDARSAGRARASRYPLPHRGDRYHIGAQAVGLYRPGTAPPASTRAGTESYTENTKDQGSSLHLDRVGTSGGWGGVGWVGGWNSGGRPDRWVWYRVRVGWDRRGGHTKDTSQKGNHFALSNRFASQGQWSCRCGVYGLSELPSRGTTAPAQPLAPASRQLCL